MGMFSFLFAGKRPSTLGVRDGRLAPCPGTPNCVSSQSEKARQRVEPIPFPSSPEAARARLLVVLGGMDGIEVITSEPLYIHAEARTAGLGFVDDLEILLDPEARLIHLRSASRLGISDRGVNHARVREIRHRFLDSGLEPPASDPPAP